MMNWGLTAEHIFLLQTIATQDHVPDPDSGTILSPLLRRGLVAPLTCSDETGELTWLYALTPAGRHFLRRLNGLTA